MQKFNFHWTEHELLNQIDTTYNVVSSSPISESRVSALSTSFYRTWNLASYFLSSLVCNHLRFCCILPVLTIIAFPLYWHFIVSIHFHLFHAIKQLYFILLFIFTWWSSFLISYQVIFFCFVSFVSFLVQWRKKIKLCSTSRSSFALCHSLRVVEKISTFIIDITSNRQILY